MRLQDLIEKIESLIPLLNVRYEKSDTNGLVFISGHVKAVKSILEIEELGILKDLIGDLRQIDSVFTDRTDRIKINVNTYNSFESQVMLIRECCISIVEASKLSLNVQNETTLSIKAPKLDDLKKFAKFIEKIDKSFNQLVVNEYTKGKVVLSGIESGSMWINVDVGTITNVMLVGSAVWSAAVIRKKVYEGNLVQSKVEALNIQNDALKIIKDGLEKEVNAVCDSEARQLLKENGIENNDPEFLERAKYSIKMFAEIINEGAQIHHSLMAPEKVSNLFPDYNKIDTVESKIMRIEDREVG